MTLKVSCTESGAQMSTIAAPSLERASLIQRESGVSRTGCAESSWTLHKAPERLVDGRFLIIGGFCGLEKAYYPLAEELTALGADVVTMDLPTYQLWHHQYQKEHFLKPERLLAQMTLRIINDVNNAHGTEQVNALGHSTGGPGSAHAAERKPELFNSIILAQPAGTAENGVIRIASRAPQVGLEGFKRAQLLFRNLHPYSRDLGVGYLKYARNMPRRVMEMVAVCQSDIVPNIKRVQSAGVNVAMILARHDKFFRLEEIIARVDGLVEESNIKLLDECHLVEMSHPEKVARGAVDLVQGFKKPAPHSLTPAA